MGFLLKKESDDLSSIPVSYYVNWNFQSNNL